jgi:hypothetical protein
MPITVYRPIRWAGSKGAKRQKKGRPKNRLGRVNLLPVIAAGPVQHPTVRLDRLD